MSRLRCSRRWTHSLEKKMYSTLLSLLYILPNEEKTFYLLKSKHARCRHGGAALVSLTGKSNIEHRFLERNFDSIFLRYELPEYKHKYIYSRYWCWSIDWQQIEARSPKMSCSAICVQDTPLTSFLRVLTAIHATKRERLRWISRHGITSRLCGNATRHNAVKVANKLSVKERKLETRPSRSRRSGLSTIILSPIRRPSWQQQHQHRFLR